jgi:hypothetical protein
MSKNPGVDSADLLRNYQELAAGLCMIRRAIEKAFRAGMLPPIERIGITPLDGCEEIARAIYAAAAKQQEQAGLMAERNVSVVREFTNKQRPLRTGKHRLVSI